MKFYVTMVFAVFLFFWLLSLALFSGVLPASWLPASLSQLELPTSFAHLGEAMATLDGLFSSIAIVLGLVAILFQGKELQASTEAQTLQAAALTQQISQQEESNRLGAYSVRLSFLSAEIDHMGDRISAMVGQADGLTQKGEAKKAADLWVIIKRTRAKQENYRKQAEQIDLTIQQLLNTGV